MEPTDPAQVQAYARILRLARRMVADDPDDTAHDAWLRTHARIDDTHVPDVYLRTAIRWARDMRARAGLRRRRRENALAQLEPDDGARLELVIAVLEAVENLSALDRGLIWQRFVDGRSAAELAKSSGLAPEAVRQRLSRALRNIRGHLDDDYGGRAAWTAVAATIDGSKPIPALGVSSSSTAAPSQTLVPGVLAGTLGGLAIAWGMSCSRSDLEAPASATGAKTSSVVAPEERDAPDARKPERPTADRRPQAGSLSIARRPAPPERSPTLAALYGMRFDAETYRRFRGEVHDSFTECVRDWNINTPDDTPTSGKTVFIIELDVVPDDRVDVHDVWTEEDTATMRELVECVRHGLTTISVDDVVGALPDRMRVVLDGTKQTLVAVPVLDLEGLPEDLREDSELLRALSRWMMGRAAPPPTAAAAVERFSHALADGRIARGELDNDTIETLRSITPPPDEG